MAYLYYFFPFGFIWYKAFVFYSVKSKWNCKIRLADSFDLNHSPTLLFYVVFENSAIFYILLPKTYQPTNSSLEITLKTVLCC